MAILKRSPFATALAIPGIIFLSCALITLTSAFKQRPDLLSIGILLDLLIVAPAIYFLFIRKTNVSKITVLRVFVLGIFVAGAILSGQHSEIVHFLKTWIAPVAELSLIGFVVYRFWLATRNVSTHNTDFLVHCRAVLTIVFGSEKVARLIASEVSVFYYLFKGKSAVANYETTFTGHKRSGVKAVLGVVLFVFLAEATGMHFVFMLWNKTAAWILTSLSVYTCLQVFAHMRALNSRLTVITETGVSIRNGIMGGEADISFQNIERIEVTRKPVKADASVKLALLKGFENHTVVIYLKEPIRVIKAFGMTKDAKVILTVIDEEEKFVEAFHSRV